MTFTMCLFFLSFLEKGHMYIIYFFVGLIILVAVWFVSYSYRKRKSLEVPKEKSVPDGDNDNVMYR
jgi:Ca2+/Na+ antiporter